MDIEDIHKKYLIALESLESSDVISFDVFDTLLLRKVVQPIDVFRILELDLGVEGFADSRVEAERDARRLAPSEFRSEVTLDEIYQALGTLRAELRDRLDVIEDLEVTLERKLSAPHPYGELLFRRAVDLERRIVFVSDMYLPDTAVRELLSLNGYGGDYSLFLSCKCRCSKSGGELFDLLLERLDCAPASILHIGDNSHSDHKMALRAGLKAAHVPKLSDTLKSTADRPLGESVLEALRLERRAARRVKEAESKSFWGRTGEEVAAQLYVGFVQDLVERTQQKNLKKLFFCSRDGRIMKDVFDLIVAERKGYPKSEYFLTSRRASVVASMDALGNDELKFLVESGMVLTVREYLQRIHLDADQFGELIMESGFENADDCVKNPMGDGRLKQLFENLESQILTIANQERDAYLEYMDSVGVFEEANVAFVDVGWNATVFGALSKLIHRTNEDTRTTGFFFGTFDLAHRQRGCKREVEAYFCQDCKPLENYRALKHSVAIFELLFSSPEASLLNFERSDARVAPRLDESSMIDEHAIIVEEIQSAAIELIREYLEVCDGRMLGISKEYATEPVQRLLTKPSSEEACAWGNVAFWPDFGRQSREQFIAKPQSLLRYLVNPWQMKFDYRRSHWRAGFFRRLPLLHRTILRILCPKLKFAYKAS